MTRHQGCGRRGPLPPGPKHHRRLIRAPERVRELIDQADRGDWARGYNLGQVGSAQIEREDPPVLPLSLIGSEGSELTMPLS